MKSKFMPLVAVAAIALGACGVPDTALAQDQESAAPVGPALWQLSDEDTTIYLFGTIHVLPEGETWFDERISSAFAASEELVFEISMDEIESSAQTVASMAMLEGGQTLRSLMAEDDLAEYEAALGELGIPAAAFDPIEPWAASLTLGMLPLQMAGWTPEQGVEMQLRAMGEDKQRSALETVEEQIGLFDSLPMDAQLELLDATVEAIPEVVPGLDALKAEWIAGDAEELGAMMTEELSDPELFERLLVNRNRNWVGWIENRLETPGTVFIAVGAGHLAGEGSVQDILGERGYTVERITH